jgi:hypothetical protein
MLHPIAGFELFHENINGHWGLSVTGRALTINQEANAIKQRDGGDCLPASCQEILRDGSYTLNHLLNEGETYHLVLVPGREIPSPCTTMNARAYVQTSYGYGIPSAGIMFRLFEVACRPLMQALGADQIVCPHDSIIDSDGDTCILVIDYSIVLRDGASKILDTQWEFRPDNLCGQEESEWQSEKVVFVFLEKKD